MHTSSEVKTVRLRSGEHLTIRPARREDSASVTAFFEGLSSEARLLRYHSPVPIVRWWMVEAVTGTDHDRREALLAFLDGDVVGVAEWGRDPDDHDRAHVAIVVDDHVRRRGIARELMKRLTVVARVHGIRDFVATVMTINKPVFGLIERMAPVRTSNFDGDAVEVVIPLARAAGA
ncbi:MAG TPA: GNAT family N-acetyltransferase [Actinomycetota bacterium]|nr:GNAT family N-acetyltransferase [Actinomycetota bacterium]